MLIFQAHIIIIIIIIIIIMTLNDFSILQQNWDC